MTSCSLCGHDNIEGADICEQCQQPLDDVHLPVPATAVERSLLEDRIDVLRPKKRKVVAPDTPVSEVLRLLVEQAIGCVVVVDDDCVVGIFSERDALMQLNTDAAKLGDRPVSEFMTASPQTLAATAKIAFTVQRMDQGGYRHVPIVTDDGRLVDVISARDILRYLTEKMSANEQAEA